ncbi:uncharacterized protein LOC114317813 isoform X3 [Camellia sinensis]|nr:uncharacterized protein LOC114317813 isoform X3 [Camellia sinensis]XP_028120391.1 uncharacterized protein LOC114317813 isoform X3 [Camellia sinensis]XP_028120392.1 uncharacterized protein LOC114317813 isoform X3 [Camellia sinensis]XP_028120394.1 uncharacterized protein LOC114317813 isoform X3 [Camellia sinensis]
MPLDDNVMEKMIDLPELLHLVGSLLEKWKRMIRTRRMKKQPQEKPIHLLWRAEEETARLCQEFVESFQGENIPGSKVFVRGGTINVNDGLKIDSKGQVWRNPLYKLGNQNQYKAAVIRASLKANYGKFLSLMVSEVMNLKGLQI